MLDGPELSQRNQSKLSGMGVSARASVLVYQWDRMSWGGAGKLAEKDEDMQEMRRVQFHGA